MLLDNNNCETASITFRFQDKIATSLPYCPYAGMELNSLLSPDEMLRFIDQITHTLAQSDIERIIIKQCPEFIDPRMDKLIKTTLLQAGFEISSSETNQHISLQNGQQHLIHKMEHRKLKKCQESGFYFSKSDPSQLEYVHRFISKCRRQQGLTINVKMEVLKNLFEKVEGAYELFTVKDTTGNIVAGTVTVRVSKAVVYNYLPAFDRKYIKTSPMVMLYNGLYEYFGAIDCKVLDLGISSINGTIQNGLFQFKKRMGAEASMRHTFIKNI